MKKLVVPTDFSTNAMKAITYSAEIARRSGAVIQLIHVIEPITDRIHQPYPLHDRLEEEMTNARLRELNILKETLSTTYPDVTIHAELAKGPVAASILDYAEISEADLIIMGTHGASGLKEILLGSVTGATVGRTRIPVLAVPFDYLMEEPDAIVFATNHFERNRQILDKIVELASLFNAKINAVVFIDTDKSDAEDYMSNTKSMDSYLNFLKQTYPGSSFSAELLDGKDFEESLEQFDTKNNVDIIAMIAYPKSFWERLLKKSTTKKMAFHSSIPVLAIPST